MIRITQLKMEIHNQNFKKKIASVLKLAPEQIQDYTIRKRSIDARKKPELFYVYTIDVTVDHKDDKFEQKLVARLKNPSVTIANNVQYEFPYQNTFFDTQQRPLVIGSGPAGLFCAYFLARNGFRPIVLERGEQVEERKKKVDHFWETGILDSNCNVQFGEGGAGTFSDGKLNTLVKDKDGRNAKVMELFVEYGADPQILYDYKAHLGTDQLINIVRNMRNAMTEMGADFMFNTCMKRLLIQEKKVTGIETTDGRIFHAGQVVLAIGHSARDTFEMLYEQQIPMEPKDFAVGFRVMHPQKLINHSQYGMDEEELLGAAPYKLTGAQWEQRNAYSFCMCPGGYVVNASSEEGRLAVNGMSYSKRDSDNANSAIIMMVKTDDYLSAQTPSPLDGIAFQREIEQRAYTAGNGKIPIETLEDFRTHVNEKSLIPEIMTQEAKQTSLYEQYFEAFTPCIKGNYVYGEVHSILPEALNQTFLHAMQYYDSKIHGFNHGRTLLAGVESRTSSPIRIVRGENLMSEIEGLYPCGEGAGYAGGITSAAMDGIRVAEQVARALLQ